MPYRKSRQEANLYKLRVHSSSGYTSTSNNELYEGLVGSAQVTPIDNKNLAKNSKHTGKKRLMIKNYAKRHALEVIVSLILIPVISWLLTNTISMLLDVDLLKYRIDVAETNVQKLNQDSVTTEYLSQELSYLKLELNNTGDIEILKVKIEQIEKQIDYIINNEQ